MTMLTMVPDDTVSLASFDTGDLTSSVQPYYTDARARSAISVTDSGGDGPAIIH